MNALGNNKAVLKQRAKSLEEYGVILEDITINKDKHKTNRRLVFFIRAILIFMALYGTVAGLFDAFELQFYNGVIIVAFMLISLGISFLYSNRLTFYLGYIIIFILFLLSSVSLYFYINSGFQYFSNTVHEKYSNFFFLNATRESTIYISNEALSVTIAMIFGGAVLAILLNITISNSMSIIGTFLVTFPLIEIALYIDIKPDIIYLLMLFSVYITIGLLNRSDHFRLPSIKNAKEDYLHINKKKKGSYYYYLSNGAGMGITAFYAVIISGLFMLITSSIFYNDYDSRIVNNSLKKSVDEAVKTYIQNGLSGFFDRYDSKGGMNHGRIGGVGTVRQDFETDLIVTFVPDSYSRIYLKSYIGNNYASSTFLPDNSLSDKYPYESYIPSSMYALSEYNHRNQGLRKIVIENVDAGTDEHFPYDAISYKTKGQIFTAPFAEDKELISDLSEQTEYLYSDNTYDDKKGKVTEAVYDSYIPHLQYPKSELITKDYQKFVYETYTQENYYDNQTLFDDTLDNICEEAGLYDIDSPKKSQQYRLEVLSKLTDFYSDNFTYTLSPGSTPWRKDPIIFFLTEKRKGYCAHFASSAVLILRHMGIPARYIEGYVIDPDDVMDGKLVSDDISDWGDFDSINEKDELKVVEAEITDANAHAWVEVYIDNYGWIPYEFTVASMDYDAPSGFSLGRLFSGLLIIGENDQEAKTEVETNNTNYNLSLTFSFISTPLIYVSSFTAVLVIILTLFRSFITTVRIKGAEKKQDYRQALILTFMLFTERLKRKDKSIIHFTLRDYGQYLNAGINNADSAPDTEYLINTLQKAFYSENEMSEEEYKKCSSIIKLIKAALKSNR